MVRDIYKIIGKFRCCKNCNLKFWSGGYDAANPIVTLMDQNDWCYDCAYWNDLISHPPAYMEVINGECLRVHPEVPKASKDRTMILGSKGKNRCFLKFDGTLLRSNDIWHIGHIPERFLPLLPDTMVEITNSAYERLSNNINMCYARGCLDRYQCLRYVRDIEKENGPYNSIPPKWKTGDEHCRFFINITELKSDDVSVLENLKLK